MTNILVIEDLANLRQLLKAQLETLGFRADEAENLKSASWKVKHGCYDIFILDLKLPDGEGIRLLEKFPEETAGRTIIITANPSIPGVVEAMKKGAFDYLEKPINPKQLAALIDKILKTNHCQTEKKARTAETPANFTFDDIIYESKQMREVIDNAKILAGTTNTVLIQGETGVGKEVLSRAIHNHSPRRKEIFIPINIAAIPTELFESELFGFEKGAFTGATCNYSGRFIQAHKGTLFLDEIGELPVTIQAKLLRILDERCIYRLKSREPIGIDVRLITATNRDLRQEVDEKRFRSDLYYRLLESTITIPPLREREEDVLPLFRHFIRVYNYVYEKDVFNISRDAEDYLVNHPWEGNVRQLKNTVKSIIPFKTDDTIRLEDLSNSVVGKNGNPQSKLITLEEMESNYISKVLKITGSNISRTASILGVTRARVYRKVSRKANA